MKGTDPSFTGLLFYTFSAIISCTATKVSVVHNLIMRKQTLTEWRVWYLILSFWVFSLIKPTLYWNIYFHPVSSTVNFVNKEDAGHYSWFELYTEVASWSDGGLGTRIRWLAWRGGV